MAIVKYIKMSYIRKNGYDEVTFSAKRRGVHPETGELGMYRIADVFLGILLRFLLELDGVVIELYSVNISSRNINNKDIIVRLSHKLVEEVDMSPCSLFWLSYDGLVERVGDIPPDGLGLRIFGVKKE